MLTPKKNVFVKNIKLITLFANIELNIKFNKIYLLIQKINIQGDIYNKKIFFIINNLIKYKINMKYIQKNNYF